MSIVYEEQPSILEIALGTKDRIDHRKVRAGCHALLIPKDRLSDKGFVLLGAVTDQGLGIQDSAKRSLLQKLFPEEHENYYPTPLSDEQLEGIIGLHSGFIHFFLADDALQNMDGIALDSSYATPEVPDGYVIFTMHERFFFICGLEDLSKWLKTDEARVAYDRKLRIAGHKFLATLHDLDDFSPQDILSIDQFVHQKGDNISRIPTGNLATAYLSAVDKASRITPHLTWNSPVVAGQLQIQQRISGLLSRR